VYNGTELWKKRAAFELVEEKLPSGRVVETFPGLPESLYEAVAGHAERIPEKLAAADDFGHGFTYKGLKEAADRFGAVLKYRFGVKKGDHAALMMYSSMEFVVALLALNKLGAVAVMLPTKYRKKEICALSDRADLKLVICDTDYSSYFEAYRDQLLLLEYHSSKESFAFTKMWDGDHWEGAAEGGREDVSVMMFTSGTTSLSKAVMLTNYAYLHAVAVYQKLFAVTEKDSTVIPVPIYMITGLSALLGLLLFSGGTVYLQQFFHAKEVLRCIQDKKVTLIHAAPTVYSLLLAEKEEGWKLGSLRLLACGGGRTSKQMEEKIHEWLPNASFRTVYGMTETASPAAILPENAALSTEPESNGLPIPGIVFKIVDEEGREVSCGQRGEILMRGTNLLQEYYKMDTSAFQDGWLRTGDVGYMTEDGYCYVADRIKDMINRGGEKIVSSDVEKELLEAEGVEEAVVVGIPHPVYGEVPAALIKPVAGCRMEEEELKDFLKTRMAGYKVPVKILAIDKIPLTANGKYDKKYIKTLF
jgi:long-chain acyl-CoA synthetase